MFIKSIRMRTGIVFLALILLSGLLAGSVGATPEAISRVTISDVRDISFVVSWTTDSASNGTVTWGTTTIPAPSNAVADAVASTTTHYVRITNLVPSTTYYFKVSSGTDVDDNGGAYYQVTTGPSLLPNAGNVIWGYVYQSDGTTVVPNAIVYLQLQDTNSGGSPGVSQLVSERANSSGVWSYNLANVRTSDLAAWFIYTPGADNLRIIGQGGSQGTRGLDPAPWIILAPASSPFQQNIVLTQAPTAVTLATFSGEAHPGSVQLEWETGHEVGLLGFNLYRAETPGGVRDKLNQSLIQAQTPGSLSGNAYQYQDGAVEAGETYYYWIELVMQDGSQENGPVSLLAPYGLWLPMVRH